MTERFYNIDHLSTEQLQELYTDYIKQGWKDFDYYKLMPEGVHPSPLSDAEVIINISADNEGNYCVLMIDCEGEKDGIMFGLGLSYYPDFAVYLHIPLELLDELVEKYALHFSHEQKDQSIEEFLTNDDISLN